MSQPAAIHDDVMVTGDPEPEDAVTEADHWRMIEAEAEHEALMAAEMDKIEVGPDDFDDVFQHHEPAPDPDQALLRLIDKHARMTAANDKRAEALFWEVIHRDAMTAAGHAAKLAMVAAANIADSEMTAIAWKLGHEAGRLGVTLPMPKFLR
jgi:hypothetical protein